MISSYIALDYKCNHNCICCPISTFDKMYAPLRYEILEKQIIDLCNSVDKCLKSKIHIVISGGEPTINKDFLPFLKLLFINKIHVTVLSNASSCADNDYVNKLLELLNTHEANDKFNYVSAIHSLDAVLHDKITNVSGSLAQTMKGLDNLIKVGISVTVKHIMNKMTYESMPETFSYLDKHFPENVRFQFCNMDYCGKCLKNLDDLFLTLDKIQPYFEKTLDLLEVENIKRKSHISQQLRKISIIEVPLCMTDPYYWKYYKVPKGNLSVYIAPNDKNIENKSLDVQSECGTYYEPCIACDVKNWCQGVWRSAYRIAGESLLRPINTIV